MFAFCSDVLDSPGASRDDTEAALFDLVDPATGDGNINCALLAKLYFRMQTGACASSQT